MSRYRDDDYDRRGDDYDRRGGRGGGGGGPNRVSLLVRNLPHDVRPDDVRTKFEAFGEIRDVYLPLDYYTKRPRGFGFIEFRDTRDAEEAMHQLDRSTMGGREISVVLSKESRKTPHEMLRRERQYGSGPPPRSSHRERRRSYSRSPRRRSYSRSRSPRRVSRSRSPPRRRRSPSRSRSPAARARSYSRSPRRERSASPRRQRSVSPRRERSISPRRERSASPRRERSASPRRERSASPRRDERSRSPDDRPRSPARSMDRDEPVNGASPDRRSPSPRYD